MAESLDPKQIMTIEELAISSMWEMAALLEILERKGICTKQEVLDMIQELRRNNAKAVPPAEQLPEPYLLTEVENALIDRLFELFNASGLNAHQARNLLERVRRLVELGERIGKKTTH